MVLTMLAKPLDVLIQLNSERMGTKNYSVIFFLDRNKEIITIHKQACTEDSNISIHDIFIPAFYVGAVFIVIVQVKPKKRTCAPNTAEKELTKIIIGAGRFLNLQILDYMIVTKNKYYSFHESKLI